MGGILFSISIPQKTKIAKEHSLKNLAMTFKEIINQDKSVLVDFSCYMVWSCKMMAPILEN